MFRKFLLTLAAVLLLTSGARFAFATLQGAGKYLVHGSAAKGTVDVDGSGTFTISDDGKNLTFSSAIGKGKPYFDMGEREEHAREQFALQPSSQLTLTVPDAELRFPEPGKKLSGQANGQLKFGAGEQTVRISYTAREEAGHYVLESAEFKFDYTRHRASKKPICLMMICVAPEIAIKVAKVRIDGNHTQS
jgi:hypothetical protein